MPRTKKRRALLVGVLAALTAVVTSSLAFGAFESERPGKPKNPHRSVLDLRTKAEKKYNMPYEPGIITNGGKLLWFGGSNALPLYHEHPHDPKVAAQLPEDPYRQAVIALREIERVLKGACASWSDVVLMDVFLTDEAAQFGYFKASAEIVGPHFPRNPTRGWPSGTLTFVDGLSDPKAVIEVSGVAVIPTKRRC